MGDAFKKVQAGQPLEIPAAAWNAMLEVAGIVASERRDGGASPLGAHRSSGIVPIKNYSTTPRARFDVLGISNVVFDPATKPEGFENHPALVGVTPSVPTHLGRFAILLEPLAADPFAPDRGAIGLALVRGVCPVKLHVLNAAHQYADVADGAAGSLTTGQTGAARTSGSSRARAATSRPWSPLGRPRS